MAGSRALADVWRVDQGSCVEGDPLATCSHVTLVTAAAAWAARHSHSAAAFAGRMWIMGGAVGGSRVAEDVWSSLDGAEWTREAASAGVGARMGAVLVPLILPGEGANRHRLLLSGGMSQTGSGELFFGDVWGATWTEDGGLAWEQLTKSPGFPARAYQAWSQANFGGQPRVWISGGLGQEGEVGGEIWTTADGVTWTQMAKPPFAARAGHLMAYCRGEVYVLGGVGGAAANADQATYWLHDAWAYGEGTWRLVSGKLPLTPRESSAMVCSQGRRLVMSGGQKADGGRLKDVQISPCSVTQAGVGCSK